MRTSKYYVRDDCSVSKNEMIQTRAPLSYYVRDVCSVSKNEICQSIKKIISFGSSMGITSFATGRDTLTKA